MQFLQLVISGIAQGCIYGLIALGFVLIYKATETVSFAQGELMMLGAFLGLAAMTMLGFPFWLAVLSAIVAMALFGLVLETLVIRPILASSARALPATEIPLALPPAFEMSGALDGEVEPAFPMPAFGSAMADMPDLSAVEEDPASRLRRLIEERQAESIEILRNWMETEEEPA